MNKIKSTSDPILDARAICAANDPISRDDLVAELVELGWHDGIAHDAINVGTGHYITLVGDKFSAVINRPVQV